MPTSIDSILRSVMAGDVIGPDHQDFMASHSGFNLAAQHQPDLVAHATSAEDVAAAVRFGADYGLPVRVQATGHGIGIPMVGGLLISTNRMRQLAIDPVKRTATVGAGTCWQDVIDAAAQRGLATLCGSSPAVGVVGYTLGGGMGPMARTFGFASDRVRRLQLIDATGRIVDIDPTREPELFWALRGGKPDIGIVTELEFSLVDAPTYYGGAIFYPGDQAQRVLHEFCGWAPTMPESVTTSIALLRLPDIPDVPEPLRGRLSVQLRYVHIGDSAGGAELLEPMRQIAPPIFDLVDVTGAAAIASVHQDPKDPMPARDDAMVLREFGPDAVDALLAVAEPDVDVPLIIAEIRLMGGRQGANNLCVIGPYPPPLVDAVDACMTAVLDALQPWSAGGTLISFQGYATSPDQVRAAWDPAVRERLDTIKQTWDPAGVFRFSYVAI